MQYTYETHFGKQETRNVIINQISLGSNTHDIVFYGSIENLISKLLNESVNMQIISNSECIISVNK